MEYKWFSSEDSFLLKCSVEAKGQIELPEYTKITYGAFEKCDKITKVILPSSVMAIGAAAFSGCTNLVTVDLSETQIVRIPEAIFDNCKSLKKVYLPDTIQEIGDFAFRGCYNLKQIKLSKSLQRIGDYAFVGCSSLTDVSNIPDEIDFGRKVFAGCISLRKFNFPPQNSTVPYGMFQFCKSLEDIQLGNKTDRIEDHAFDGCLSLKSINLQNVNRVGEFAFRNCKLIKDIQFGSWDEKIGSSAFDGCKNLQSVVLSDCCSIGTHAFLKCTSLKEIRFGDHIGCIDDWLSDYDLELIRTFEEKTKLEDNEQDKDGLTRPYSQKAETHLQVKAIVLSSNSDVITQEDVEYSCSEENVKYKINIPDGIRRIDNDAFYCNCKIEEIDIPSSVVEIGSNAFSDTGLEIFKCPKSITEIKDGTYAGNCINTVVITKQIKSIGEYAFSANPIERIIIMNPDCKIGLGAFFIGDGLKELHLRSYTPLKNIVEWFWGDTPMDRQPEYFSDCVLFVPKGTAYLYYSHREETVYGYDAPYNYYDPYLFFKDIVEE